MMSSFRYAILLLGLGLADDVPDLLKDANINCDFFYGFSVVLAKIQNECCTVLIRQRSFENNRTKCASLGEYSLFSCKYGTCVAALYNWVDDRHRMNRTAYSESIESLLYEPAKIAARKCLDKDFKKYGTNPDITCVSLKMHHCFSVALANSCPLWYKHHKCNYIRVLAENCEVY